MQYVNFEELKKQLALLEQFLAAQKTSGGNNLVWLKLLFQHTLDGEISKVLGFYAQQKEALVQTMETLQTQEKPLVLAALNVRPLQRAEHAPSFSRATHHQHPRPVQKKEVSVSVKIEFVNKLLERWRHAGRTLSNLLMFVSLNMQALRKIVKKQNKLVRFLPRRARNSRATDP